MKNKFSLCFRPVSVETEDSVLGHDHVSYDSVSTTHIVAGGNTKKSSHKNRKLLRRRTFALKHFPGLLKAIVFQDPLKNIQQIELQLKSKGPIRNRKCYFAMDSETGEPEIITEAENQPKENRARICDGYKSCGDEKSNANATNDKHKTCCSGRVSCFHLIVLVIFATIFLGRIRAIILISLGMSLINSWWWNGFFRRPLDLMKPGTAAPREMHDELKPENLTI